MTDTVTRLLALADDYALRCYHHDDPDSREAARQALEAELVRLFTPLSDEQIHKLAYGAGGIDVPHLMFARELESCHGIGGKS